MICVTSGLSSQIIQSQNILWTCLSEIYYIDKKLIMEASDQNTFALNSFSRRFYPKQILNWHSLSWHEGLVFNATAWAPQHSTTSCPSPQTSISYGFSIRQPCLWTRHAASRYRSVNHSLPFWLEELCRSSQTDTDVPGCWACFLASPLSILFSSLHPLSSPFLNCLRCYLSNVYIWTQFSNPSDREKRASLLLQVMLTR